MVTTTTEAGARHGSGVKTEARDSHFRENEGWLGEHTTQEGDGFTVALARNFTPDAFALTIQLPPDSEAHNGHQQTNARYFDIRLIDSQGRETWIPLRLKPGDSNAQVIRDFGELPSGIYELTVTNSDESGQHQIQRPVSFFVEVNEGGAFILISNITDTQAGVQERLHRRQTQVKLHHPEKLRLGTYQRLPLEGQPLSQVFVTATMGREVIFQGLVQLGADGYGSLPLENLSHAGHLDVTLRRDQSTLGKQKDLRAPLQFNGVTNLENFLNASLVDEYQVPVIAAETKKAKPLTKEHRGLVELPHDLPPLDGYVGERIDLLPVLQPLLKQAEFQTTYTDSEGVAHVKPHYERITSAKVMGIQPLLGDQAPIQQRDEYLIGIEPGEAVVDLSFTAERSDGGKLITTEYQTYVTVSVYQSERDRVAFLREPLALTSEVAMAGDARSSDLRMSEAVMGPRVVDDPSDYQFCIYSKNNAPEQKATATITFPDGHIRRRFISKFDEHGRAIVRLPQDEYEKGEYQVAVTFADTKKTMTPLSMNFTATYETRDAVRAQLAGLIGMRGEEEYA